MAGLLRSSFPLSSLCSTGLLRGIASGANRQGFEGSGSRAERVLQERRKRKQQVRDSRLERRAPPPEPARGSELERFGLASELVTTNKSQHTLSARVLSRHSSLVVSREIEWGTVLLGYEQANKYTVRNGQSGDVVAHMAEETGVGNWMARQFLHRRRPFTTTVFGPEGEFWFRARRPLYLWTTSIYIEDENGNVIGEVLQRFSLLQRQYDLYLGKDQFAAIRGGFLSWDFTLEDAQGRPLALIDRNFQGLMKELFTDAGKYVIHFGEKSREETTNYSTPRLSSDTKSLIETGNGQLEVVRSLRFDERMIALAAAISIDFDYFSQHSDGRGMGAFLPWMMPMPMPMPTPDASSTGETPADAPPAGEASENPYGASGDAEPSWGSYNDEEAYDQDDGHWSGEDDSDGGDFDWGDFGGFFDDD